MTTLKNGLLGIENKFKETIVNGPDGKPIQDPAKKAEFKQQSIKKYKTDFVNDLLRNPGGLSSNGLDVIQADPELNDIYQNIMKKEQDRIKGTAQKEQAQKIISENKSVNINVVKQLKNIKADMTKDQLYKFLLQAYPKVPGVSVEDHAANINKLVEEAYK